MIREEDRLQELSQERLTRVQRALDGRNVGLKQEDFGAVSPPRRVATGTSTGTGASAAMVSASRRHGVLFTTDSEDASYIEAEYEHTVAQNNMRRAQDKLLLQQLDNGVLPERFIKHGMHTDDPRHVSVILSKFGIGDLRGICLGRWWVIFLKPIIILGVIVFCSLSE